MNSPEYRTKLNIEGIEDLKRSVEVSFNLLFLGVIIAALIISSSLVYPHREGWMIGQIPGLSLIGYLLAGGLSVVAFINFIKKS